MRKDNTNPSSFRCLKSIIAQVFEQIASFLKWPFTIGIALVPFEVTTINKVRFATANQNGFFDAKEITEGKYQVCSWEGEEDYVIGIVTMTARGHMTKFGLLGNRSSSTWQ